jgi:hypothetical protein
MAALPDQRPVNKKTASNKTDCGANQLELVQHNHVAAHPRDRLRSSKSGEFSTEEPPALGTCTKNSWLASLTAAELPGQHGSRRFVRSPFPSWRPLSASDSHVAGGPTTFEGGRTRSASTYKRERPHAAGSVRYEK